MMTTPQNNTPTEIIALLAKVSERFEQDDSGMKQWITQKFGNPVLVELLQDTTMMGLRVLDAVGQLEPVNGITISKQYRIPKGSVSKTTRKLVAKKLMTQEALLNNKKEILFRLTPLGKQLFEAHRAFDQQMEKGFIRFLEKYQPAELQFIAHLLQDIAEASFLAE